MTSRYEELFGSPERVVITFATIDEWLAAEIALSNLSRDGREWYAPGPYYMLEQALGANTASNARELLDWLLGDAE